MADRWQPGFDVYSAEVQGGRAVFLVDLNAADHAPLESHPVRLHLRVDLQRPREDGLRADDEADALYQLEDRVVPAVEQKLGGIYVGRYTAGGAVSFVFYMPAGTAVGGDHLMDTLGDTAPYAPEVALAPDPDWSFFNEILMPSEYSMQEIQNRRVLAHMQELGDRPEVPRELDHYAYFAGMEQAARASAALRRHGFRVDEMVADDDGRVCVGFHRIDHLVGGRADAVAWEILDIVLEDDGEYDGWGAPIMKMEESA